MFLSLACLYFLGRVIKNSICTLMKIFIIENCPHGNDFFCESNCDSALSLVHFFHKNFPSEASCLFWFELNTCILLKSLKIIHDCYFVWDIFPVLFTIRKTYAWQLVHLKQLDHKTYGLPPIHIRTRQYVFMQTRL